MSSQKIDRSMSIVAASTITIIAMLPFMVLLVMIYNALWGLDNFYDGLARFLAWESILPAILIGVPAHEGIHALTWLWLGRVPKERIRFGVKSLTPNTHCEVPMPSNAYRAGAIMPAVILGFIPYAIGLATGSGWFMAFGLTFIFAAGGDFLVLWILRGVKGDTIVEDHPTRVGCYIFE